MFDIGNDYKHLVLPHNGEKCWCKCVKMTIGDALLVLHCDDDDYPHDLFIHEIIKTICKEAVL